MLTSFSELPLCSILEGFFHIISAKLPLCMSRLLSNYSSKTKCQILNISLPRQITYQTGEIPLQEAKEKNWSICLRVFCTLESHGCFCFDMPTACGSTDDFPYLLTAKVITNHITSAQQKKTPNVSLIVLFYPLYVTCFLGCRCWYIASTRQPLTQSLRWGGEEHQEKVKILLVKNSLIIETK